jgi:hypothetical protein
VGHHAFFRAGAGQDLISDCIRLGMVFHCSPLEFADLPMSTVYELMTKYIEVQEAQRNG